MNDNRTIYVAGHYPPGESAAWELMGLFDAEADAIEACTTDRHFYGAVPANTRLPDESV